MGPDPACGGDTGAAIGSVRGVACGGSRGVGEGRESQTVIAGRAQLVSWSQACTIIQKGPKTFSS
jgi:hypothetical protein